MGIDNKTIDRFTPNSTNEYLIKGFWKFVKRTLSSPVAITLMRKHKLVMPKVQKNIKASLIFMSSKSVTG